MAQTAGKILGRTIRISVDPDPDGTPDLRELGCQVENNADRSTSDQEARCKDDGNFSVAIPDENSMTGSITLIMRNDTPGTHYGYSDLHAWWKAQTNLEWTVSSNVVGDPIETFRGHISSLGDSHPVSGASQVTLSIKVTQEPVLAVVN